MCKIYSPCTIEYGKASIYSISYWWNSQLFFWLRFNQHHNMELKIILKKVQTRFFVANLYNGISIECTLFAQLMLHLLKSAVYSVVCWRYSLHSLYLGWVRNFWHEDRKFEISNVYMHHLLILCYYDGKFQANSRRLCLKLSFTSIRVNELKLS